MDDANHVGSGAATSTTLQQRSGAERRALDTHHLDGDLNTAGADQNTASDLNTAGADQYTTQQPSVDTTSIHGACADQYTQRPSIDISSDHSAGDIGDKAAARARDIGAKAAARAPAGCRRHSAWTTAWTATQQSNDTTSDHSASADQYTQRPSIDTNSNHGAGADQYTQRPSIDTTSDHSASAGDHG